MLAALAKGGSIYVPLRSMFEQMGAAVSYDPSSKVATISKPGAEIVVTVGKPEVIVNGETPSARRAADGLQRRRYGADPRDL